MIEKYRLQVGLMQYISLLGLAWRWLADRNASSLSRKTDWKLTNQSAACGLCRFQGRVRICSNRMFVSPKCTCVCVYARVNGVLGEVRMSVYPCRRFHWAGRKRSLWKRAVKVAFFTCLMPFRIRANIPYPKGPETLVISCWRIMRGLWGLHVSVFDICMFMCMFCCLCYI